MNKTVGIIGGGQLGKMLLQYSSRLSINTHVYDPSELSVCKNLCDNFSIGSFMDYNKIMEFGRKCDIVTYEIEHICVQALYDIEKEGIAVYPRPHVLETIQNKNTQKQFFRENSLPTCDFKKYNNIHTLKNDIIKGIIKLPVIWKKTTSGYDGFGVKKINTYEDINNLSDGECIVENCVEIKKELSIIVARNISGDIKIYNPLEMIFDENSNQLVSVFQPSQIPYDIENECINISKKVVSLFNYVGIIAIELFYTRDNCILINEIAPRPHNSGHLTIENCCQTSQFEQHIRAILNMNLGETTFYKHSTMINIVGHENSNGVANYNTPTIVDLFSVEGLYVHIYGKKETRPNRKLGHITVVSSGKNYKNNIKKAIKSCKIYNI
jgi:5-(carboxyamino)imidazole ribonucleotide synthase